MDDPETFLEGRVMDDLDPRDRVEEARRLWEIVASRVCLFAELITMNPAGMSLAALKLCVEKERDAWRNWQAVSREVGG